MGRSRLGGRRQGNTTEALETMVLYLSHLEYFWVSWSRAKGWVRIGCFPRGPYFHMSTNLIFQHHRSSLFIRQGICSIRSHARCNLDHRGHLLSLELL